MDKFQKRALFAVGFIIHLLLTIWIFIRIASCGILVGCVTQADRTMEAVIGFPLIFVSKVVPWKGQDGSGHGVSWDFFFLMWPVNSLIVVTILALLLKVAATVANYSLKRTAAGRLR
jgi:hypothetical protein